MDISNISNETSDEFNSYINTKHYKLTNSFDNNIIKDRLNYTDKKNRSYECISNNRIIKIDSPEIIDDSSIVKNNTNNILNNDNMDIEFYEQSKGELSVSNLNVIHEIKVTGLDNSIKEEIKEDSINDIKLNINSSSNKVINTETYNINVTTNNKLTKKNSIATKTNTLKNNELLLPKDINKNHRLSNTGTLSVNKNLYKQNTISVNHDVDPSKLVLNKYNKKTKRHEFIWKNGDKFEGQVENGKYLGLCKIVKRDNYVFEGEFVDGKRNGPGKLFSNNNELIFSGTFLNGKKHGYGEELTSKYKYYGDFYNGDKTGKATIILKYEKYKGDVKNGKFHGYGILKYSNGNIYKGSFRKGLFDGEGIFKWANGRKYIGSYKNGKKNGYGVFEYGNSKIIEGIWNNGILDGDGYLIDANKKKLKANWKNGKIKLLENNL